jgi:hypothetical protein
MSKFIAEMFATVAIKFFDKAAKGPKHIQGKGPGKVEKKLKKQLKKAGWISIVFLVLLVGCSRVVYVPHGQAVQLRQDVKDVKVWALSKDGERIPGKLKVIPEGWMCLPLEGDSE